MGYIYLKDLRIADLGFLFSSHDTKTAFQTLVRVIIGGKVRYHMTERQENTK